MCPAFHCTPWVQEHQAKRSSLRKHTPSTLYQQVFSGHSSTQGPQAALDHLRVPHSRYSYSYLAETTLGTLLLYLIILSHYITADAYWRVWRYLCSGDEDSSCKGATSRPSPELKAVERLCWFFCYSLYEYAAARSRLCFMPVRPH